MRPIILAGAVALGPVAVAAQDRLFCQPVMFCSGTSCNAIDPANTEAGVAVEDPMGAAPVIWSGEGRQTPVTRDATAEIVTWSGINVDIGGTVYLSVRRQGGHFVYVQHEALAGDRVWLSTGRCE